MPYLSFASSPMLHGIHQIMAYRNRDGHQSGQNCGLAASATALRYKHRFTDEHLWDLEERFPPDILFGLFGTSKSRVCEILSSYNCAWREVEGRHALQHALRQHRPVLVMLSLPRLLPSGHWMVAYAYDRHHIWVTNYHSHHDRMHWSTFQEGWGSWLAWSIDMDNTGIAIL